MGSGVDIHLVPSLGTGPLPLLCGLLIQYKEVTSWASFLLFHNQPWTLPDPGPKVLMLQLVSRDLGALEGVPCLWVHVSCPGSYHASSQPWMIDLRMILGCWGLNWSPSAMCQESTLPIRLSLWPLVAKQTRCRLDLLSVVEGFVLATQTKLRQQLSWVSCKQPGPGLSPRELGQEA